MDTRVVATFTYRHEAEFARAILELAGIQSVVATDDGGGAYPFSLTPVRLIVRARDYLRARTVLDRSEP